MLIFDQQTSRKVWTDRQILQKKDKFQIFTPSEIAYEMVQYSISSDGLLGKMVLEPSTGNGNLLIKVVEHCIAEACVKGINSKELASFLSTHIVGYELDQKLLDECRSRLNGLLEYHGIDAVEWRLYKEDFLFADIRNKFDFVIGNPPYLEYKNIPFEYREILKNSFVTCKKGKFDYCYAFIEKSLQILADDGVLVQLVPNSIFKNKYGKVLRELLIDGIEFIADYSNKNLFQDALVSSSVFVYKQSNAKEIFEYRIVPNKVGIKVFKDVLGEKWTFSYEKPVGNSYRLGDYFHANMPIATLNNEAFLLNSCEIEGHTNLIRRAASPKGMARQKAEWIIFPYEINKEGFITRIKLDRFERVYPQIARHLRKFFTSLANRKADRGAAWFEYGRSQGLTLANKNKLLLSTIISSRVRVYELEAKVIPYSGIVVTQAGNQPLCDAKKILESEDFANYARSVGTSVSGKSFRITCKDIENYSFSDWI